MAAAGLIRGVVGQVRWSYYNAAAINGYTAVRNKPVKGSRWSLRATIVMSDKFKMSQRPLVFVAPHAKGRFQWPIEELTIDGDQLTARLGPLEEY